MTRGRVVAVIDVGSNSVRLLVARQLSPGAFEVVDEERFDARLGEGQDDGALSPESVDRGLRALRQTTQVALSYGPAALVAVGTEALRRATNAHEFVAAARAQTGVSVQVLSTEAEAHASYLGVINSTTLTDGAIIDIGGGSLEWVRVEQRALASSVSAPLGALYARDRYLKSDRPTSREVRALRKAVRQQLGRESAAPVLYGVGGAVRNIARMVRLRRRYPLRRLHGLSIDRRDVRRIARDLARVGADERRKLPGVSAARAETLHAAAIVLDEVMDIAGAATLVVSGQGLREGLVWQEFRTGLPLIPNVRAASVAGLAQANGLDDAAAEPVVIVAAHLFEVTYSLHRLGPAELDLLLAAARLAGIGMHIDYYNRDRHAEYLVHSGDLHGFSHREIVLLGALVRSADSGTADLSPYRGLVHEDDARHVATLAAMLGAARAARRRVPSPVLDVKAVIADAGLHISLVAAAPVDAEFIALGRQQRRLEAALKVPVSISAVSPAEHP